MLPLCHEAGHRELPVPERRGWRSLSSLQVAGQGIQRGGDETKVTFLWRMPGARNTPRAWR